MQPKAKGKLERLLHSRWKYKHSSGFPLGFQSSSVMGLPGPVLKMPLSNVGDTGLVTGWAAKTPTCRTCVRENKAKGKPVWLICFCNYTSTCRMFVRRGTDTEYILMTQLEWRELLLQEAEMGGLFSAGWC